MNELPLEQRPFKGFLDFYSILWMTFNIFPDINISPLIGIQWESMVSQTEKLLKETIKVAIEKELKEMTEKSYEIEFEKDPDLGSIIIVRIDADAREALELNLKLLEKFRAPILFDWKGETNLPKEKLADLLAEVLIKSGVKAELSPGYSAVKAIEENRED